MRLIRVSFTVSLGIYGGPRVFLDLREAGETCSKHPVARLMREAKLRAFHGYRRGAGRSASPQFSSPISCSAASQPAGPIQAWLTNITYVHTWQGWS